MRPIHEYGATFECVILDCRVEYSIRQPDESNWALMISRTVGLLLPVAEMSSWLTTELQQSNRIGCQRTCGSAHENR